MRVLALGGCGAQGVFATKDLVESADVSAVVIADIDLEKAAKVASDIASPKLSTIRVDVNDHQGLVQAMKDVDVVLNCTGPYYELGPKVVKAAIEAGKNYVDFCDDYDATQEMLALDSLAQEKGITILVGLGASPGLANVAARYAADKLDQVDEVKIAWMIGAGEPEGPAVLYHSFHGITGAVPQFLDGKLVEVPALSGEEIIDFPQPVGKAQVFYFGHPEPVTIPQTIKGVRTVTNKGGVLPPELNELLKVFAEFGLTSPTPIMVKGREVSPRDFLVAYMASLPAEEVPPEQRLSAMTIEVKGKKEGIDVTYTYSGAANMGPGTGISASIGAQMLGRGEIKVKGVVAPEACIDPEPFMAELAKKGITFTETTTTMRNI